MLKLTALAVALTISTGAQACYVGIDCSMSEYMKNDLLDRPQPRARQQEDWVDAMRRGDRDFRDWEVDNRLDRLEQEQRYEREFGPRIERPDFSR